MSQTPEPTETTLADVMAVMQAGFAQLTTAIATTNAKVDELGAKVDHVRADVADVKAEVGEVKRDVAQVRADVLAVKVEHGFYERHQMSLQNALGFHIQDPDGHSHAA